jgi:protein TonB
MNRMLRITLCIGLLLSGLVLFAQQPAEISGDKAVRFEQSPGFFHYAALCRTGTRFTNAMPALKPPPDQTEMAVCWYLKGSESRPPGATASPEADGKLYVSAHHVRFVPHNPQFASLYLDLLRDEVELKHEPGQPYATLKGKDVVLTFRFSKLCPECAPGTPVTTGYVPALLDQEFGLLDAGIHHFDSGWKQIYRLSTGSVPGPAASRNQPAAAAASTPRPPVPGMPPVAHSTPARETLAAHKPGVPAGSHPERSTRTEVPTAPGRSPAVTAPRASAALASSRPAVAEPATAGTSALHSATSAPASLVTGTARTKPVRITSGAADGLLLKKIPPSYPLDAKMLRLEGTVVLRAVIEKTGDVAEVYALSGPPLLESAAVDAVKQWQYRPYAVNGLPVDVETTIEVVFALDGSHVTTRAQSLRK